MTVYTDGVHLVADSVAELHEFAARIGLRREWFQDHPRHPHYDLKGGKVQAAVSAGAILVSSRRIVSLRTER